MVLNLYYLVLLGGLEGMPKLNEVDGPWGSR